MRYAGAMLKQVVIGIMSEIRLSRPLRLRKVVSIDPVAGPARPGVMTSARLTCQEPLVHQ